jgi:hypothetical protein
VALFSVICYSAMMYILYNYVLNSYFNALVLVMRVSITSAHCALNVVVGEFMKLLL